MDDLSARANLQITGLRLPKPGNDYESRNAEKARDHESRNVETWNERYC